MSASPISSDERWWPRWSVQRVDAVGAIGLWVIATLLSARALVDARDWLAALVVLILYALQSAALIWRRTNVPLMLSLTVLGGLAQMLVVAALLPSDVAICVAIYSASRWSPERLVRGVALALCGVGALCAALQWPLIDTWEGTFGYFGVVGVLLVGLWLVGDLARRRARYRSRLDEQNAALLRDRDQRIALAAQQERTRIAREMHDVIAHGLTVVVVQANGAAYAAEHAKTWERAQAARALLTIAATARDWLGETRRLLSVLRSEPGEMTDAVSPRVDEFTPTATLSEIGDVIDRVRAANRSVDVHMDSDLAGLPPEVSRAAYRIVQEALTNVLSTPRRTRAPMSSSRAVHRNCFCVSRPPATP